jgi:hypothetical protein
MVVILCRQRLYNKDVNEVLLAHYKVLEQIFRTFARQTVLKHGGDGMTKLVLPVRDQHVASANILMSFEGWMALVEAIGFVDKVEVPASARSQQPDGASNAAAGVAQSPSDSSAGIESAGVAADVPLITGSPKKMPMPLPSPKYEPHSTNKFGRRHASLCFVQSRMRISDDASIKHWTEATHLTLADFFEALCRLSDMVGVPSDSELADPAIGGDISRYYETNQGMHYSLYMCCC